MNFRSPTEVPRVRLCAGASLAMILLAAGAALAAPASAPTPPKSGTVSEVTIVAPPKIEPGAVVGDIKPDIQFQPQDIQAYGVSTITELLAELAPEIGSNSGRGGEGPAILLNGRRISGVNEIRNIPTEAILRVDILPEEAALKYGFTANQRVVNIVLKDHVDAILADLQGGMATEGHGASGQAEAGITRIAGERRMNLDVKVTPVAALTEAERPILPLAGAPATDLAGAPVDPRAARTLVSESHKVALNGVYTQPIWAGVSATANATFEATTSAAQRGFPAVRLFAPGGAEIDRLATGFGPLEQTADNWTAHLGFSLNRDVSRWRLAMTGAYDHADTRNANDVGIDTGALQAALAAGAVSPAGTLPASLLSPRPRDTSHSRSDTGNVQMIASGPVWTVPAGEVRASVRLGAAANSFASLSDRAGFSRQATFTQGGGDVQGSLDVPLTSAKAKVLPWLGEVTVNTHVALQQVSGFGTLQTFGYGGHWTPVTGLSILVSRLHDQQAPSQQQTRAPILPTPNTRIFDFATGQTVDVVQISGGNPALVADDRYRTSVRVTWQPWQDRQFILRGDYNAVRYKNPFTTFPAASAAIQAAFPDRFLRNADGDLTEVDYRPVNFASQQVKTLRWGFDWSMPIGPVTQGQPPPRAAIFQQLRRAGIAGQVGRRPNGPPAVGADTAPQGPAPDLAPPPAPGGAQGGPAGFGPGRGGFAGGMGPGGGPGGMGAGRGGSQDGRLHISLFHTVYFADRFLVRPGGPVIDFLDGASLNGGAGQVRNAIQGQLNIAERGYGAELNVDWKQGSTVVGGAANGGDLAFSGLTKVGVRLFADLNQRKALIQAQPWLRGVRLSASVSNLFDQRVRVTDPAGATPYTFQPAYLDPIGRTWRIEVRKLFTSGT